MSKQRADYILVGGGSGGHIVPLLPVAESLRSKSSNPIVIVHIGHKGDPLNSVTRGSDQIDAVYEVPAGKFRRYHGQSWASRLFDVKTNLLNIRDIFRFLTGIFQAYRLLGKLKPKAIMMKGGYVCANVGIAARMRKIPYMTHDSDAMVSLAHKVIAKGAARHATAMPPEYYAGYSLDKTEQVGVPIRSDFQAITSTDSIEAKKTVGFPEDAKVVLITGGGLGARNINNAIIDSAKDLLQDEKVHLIHLTGGKLIEEVAQRYSQLDDKLQSRCIIEAFTPIMHTYSAAADVIVSRASATALTEFAAQSKACIIVPNPLLSGGHQLKNAQALGAAKAVITVHEDHIGELAAVIKDLLKDIPKQERLGAALHKAALPGAANRIADMLIEIAG